MSFVEIRTMHNEHDPLANCGRNAVRCDAQIRPHMKAVHPGDVEHRAFHTRCCHGNTTRTERLCLSVTVLLAGCLHDSVH